MLDGLRARLAARPARTLGPGDLPPELPDPGALRRAAVLVPLYAREGEPWVLLTRRPAHLRHHAGQVSFPGGRLEPGEAPLTAALREAQEEVGLHPAHVEVLGALDEVLVLATTFRLTPWVGVVPYPYPYAPQPAEVEELLQVRLAALAAPGVHRTEPREAHGARFDVHFYELPGVTVWGATARVLHQLLGLWSAR